MKSTILYCGRSIVVSCDEKCNKAWGVNNRPKVQLSGDPDDYEFLSDFELGEAPVDPGTYEGGHAKPTNKAEIPNRWCVRECERCLFLEPEERRKNLDFTKRVKNLQ